MEESQFQEPLFSKKIKFIIYFSLFVILIALGLFLTPIFMSSDKYQKHLVTEIERFTGEKVKLDNQVNISINPFLNRFTISANNLIITNGEINFITSNSLAANIPLHKLFLGDKQVSDIALDGANINLSDELQEKFDSDID